MNLFYLLTPICFTIVHYYTKKHQTLLSSNTIHLDSYELFCCPTKHPDPMLSTWRKKQTNLPILFNQYFSEAYTGPVAAYPTFHSRRSRTETFPTMGWCNKSMRPQPCCCNKTLWMWTITSNHMKWAGLIRILSQCNIEFIWNL